MKVLSVVLTGVASLLVLMAADRVPAGELNWTWPDGAGLRMDAGQYASSSLRVVRIQPDGSAEPATFTGRVKAGRSTTETWRIDDPAVDIVLDQQLDRRSGAMRVRMKAVNRGSAKASVCAAIEISLPQPVNKAILFDFTKSPYVEFDFPEAGMKGISWKAETDLNAQMGLYGYPNRNRIYNCWGTFELCNALDTREAMHSTLYLPIVSLFDSATGGIVAWCDPRSHFGFDGNHSALRLQHMFFTGEGPGAEDSGFEPGDGSGPWPYDAYISYMSHPTWDRLYALYMDCAPDLREGQRPMAEPGLVAGVRPTAGFLPLMKRLGIKYTGGVSVTYSYVDGPTPEETEWFRRRGVATFAQDGTIGMATDLTKSPVPPWEPKWIVERYGSSLIKDREGKDQWCWQGKFANPSPAFPFGRDRLDAIRKLLGENFGAFYIDLYLSGSGADWGHPVDALPFYPMSRAYYEYMGAIARETRRNGQSYNINAPHPSCLAGKYADWMTFDGDGPIWLMCRSYGELTGIPTQLWTNLQDTVAKLRPSLSDALAYGVLTGPYVVFGYLLPHDTPIPAAEKEEILAIFERHYRLAFDIAMSRIVKGTSEGGRPGPLIYYRGAKGVSYITVQNTSKRVKTLRVPLELSALGFGDDEHPSICVWDIDTGMGPQRKVAPGTDAVTVQVKPGVTSVVVIRRGTLFP